MKNVYFFILFSLLGIFNSCSETQVKNEPIEASRTAIFFNDFIPSYLYEVPNLEIEQVEHFNHVIGNYRIDAHVDSINAKVVYLKITDPKENIVYQGRTLNGKKDGWWEVLQNKTLICCGNYNSDKKYGFWRYYKLGGETKKFVNFKKDTLDGLAQEYSKDSILISEGNYVKGLKSNYWKYFHNNGKVKEQGYFHDGCKSGWWQSFESNGNLLEEASYSRNEISGYVKKYLKGILFEEGKLFNGRRRGTWKSYNEKGKLESIHEYEE